MNLWQINTTALKARDYSRVVSCARVVQPVNTVMPAACVAINAVAVNLGSIEMTKDFGHDPGGSDG